MANERLTSPVVRVDDKTAEQLRREAYRQRRTRGELLAEAWALYVERLKRKRSRAGERA